MDSSKQLNKINPAHVLNKINPTFQVYRGIAIVAVVLIHALSSVEKLVSPDHEWIYISFRQIFNFAVPLFIFLGGYFASKYEFHNLDDCWKFYQKRLSKLILPYIFWSIVGITFYSLWQGLTIKGILKIFLTGQAVGPYYFFIVFFQLIVMTPVLSYLSKNRTFVWVPLVLNVFSVLVLYIFQYESFSMGRIVFPYYALPFSMWVAFYYWGMTAKEQYFHGLCLRKIRWILLCVFMFMLFSMLEGVLIAKYTGNNSFAASQIKFSSFVYSFFIIHLLMRLRSFMPDLKVLIVFGNYSFGIFLVHIFFLNYLSSFVEKFTTNWFVVPFLVTTVVLCACLLFIYMMRKIVGERISSRVLGF